MGERKMAPHVARAIGGLQAKPAGSPHLSRTPPAPHVAAALRPPPRPAAAPVQPFAPAARPPAAHVQAAQSRAALQRQAAAPPRTPAAHVARGVAAQAKPATPAAPTRAPHVAAALAGGAQPKPAPHRLAALASHVRAAQAKMGPAGEVVQRARRTKEDLEERKKEIRKIVGKVNETIEDDDSDREDFFVSQVTSFQNEKIGIRDLPTRDLVLGRRQSQVSNFAYLVKHHFKAGPEVQIALLQDAQKQRSGFLLSTNTGRANRKLKEDLPTKIARRNVKYFYQDSLRSKNVRIRMQQVESQARRSLKVAKLRGILSNVESQKLGSKKEFLKEVSWQIARQMHKDTRRNEMRVRMKSARGLAYSSSLRKLPLSITSNSDDIHSESDILNTVGGKKKTSIEFVVGTKVPCIACQTMFWGKGVQDAILDHTSGAWLSKSSMKQLGFTPTQVRRYLLHIGEILDGVDLYQHDDPHGEIGIENMTDLDSDPSSDSEDDEVVDEFRYTAIGGTKRGDDLVNRIELFATNVFAPPKKKKVVKKKKKSK